MAIRRKRKETKKKGNTTLILSIWYEGCLSLSLWIFVNSSRARLMDVASAPVKETLGATGTQEVNSLFNYNNYIINRINKSYLSLKWF